LAGIRESWGTPGRRIRGARRPGPNLSTVTYAADAAPGMMKMESDCGSLGLEVDSGSEAVDQLRPRARPTVWPGRRYVPGIVAPRPRGSTWSRLSSTATSPAAGLRWSVSVGRYGVPKSVPSFRVRHHGSTPSRELCYPPVPHGGQGVLSRPSPNPVRDFRSSHHAALRHPETMKMVRSTISDWFSTVYSRISL